MFLEIPVLFGAIPTQMIQAVTLLTPNCFQRPVLTSAGAPAGLQSPASNTPR